MSSNQILLDSKCSITSIISEGASNLQQLILCANGPLSDIRVIVANCEIKKDQCFQIGSIYYFDLAEHKGECSVVVSFTNPNPDTILVKATLVGEKTFVSDK